MKEGTLYRVIGFVVEAIMYSVLHWLFVSVIFGRPAGFFVHVSLGIIFEVGEMMGQVTNNNNLPLKRTMYFVVGLGICVLAYCILGDSINAKGYTSFIASTFTCYTISYLFSRLSCKRVRKQKTKFNEEVQDKNNYEKKMKEETNIFYKPVDKQQNKD